MFYSYQESLNRRDNDNNNNEKKHIKEEDHEGCPLILPSYRLTLLAGGTFPS